MSNIILKKIEKDAYIIVYKCILTRNTEITSHQVFDKGTDKCSYSKIYSFAIMTSQPEKQTITMPIFPNTLRNKDNQTMKLGQLIESFSSEMIQGD